MINRGCRAHYVAMSGFGGCMPDCFMDGYRNKGDAIESLATVWDVSPSTMRRWIDGYTPAEHRGMYFDVTVSTEEPEEGWESLDWVD